MLVTFLRTNAVTLLAGALAVAGAAYIWLALPHERHITSAGLLLFKLLPFAAGVVAVAWVDQDLARRLRMPLWLMPLCFLGFFCYFVPKILRFANQGDFANAYYHMLTLVPFIILTMLLSFRLGGGASGVVVRLGTALILLQLSGLEDLAFLLLHDVRPIPEVWTWASHMTVFLGHPPSRAEAYAFITVHVVLAIAALTVPTSALRRARPVADGSGA
ncbi:hypothetical protein [Kribbella deserti]|uniref:Uncharacterized protein n=1 Tax=Kribbella deserti TaxID=1926257 RepID=A0ABV6QGE3_9ACTN